VFEEYAVRQHVWLQKPLNLIQRIQAEEKVPSAKVAAFCHEYIHPESGVAVVDFHVEFCTAFDETKFKISSLAGI
jgi:hypothetical protein